ncbi:MAG TPA: IPExxxVDY family protein, partial [Chitinophagaceae bacterium]
FYFSVFEFTEPTTAVSHYIYNNHSKAAFLLPELKNIDFLWLIKGDYYQEKEVKALIEQIRSVENIQLVTLFNQEEIKNKKDLIF